MNDRRRRLLGGALVASLLGASAASGCAAHDDGSGDAGASPFLAFASDFATYETWSSFDLGGDDASLSGEDAAAAVDDAGCSAVHDLSAPRVAFLNQRPPAGAKQFPTGTVLVKEIHRGTSRADWQTFAMVKRGGGFNPGSGCAGWEWFELDVTSTPAIVWRGAAPRVRATPFPPTPS